jgi:predicted nucleic acid-binding protein
VALTHLVDTSVLTRLHRGEIVQVVEPLASAGQLGRATISDLEVGFWARNAREWDRLMAALDAFDAIEIDADHVERARHVQRNLTDKGLRGRKVPDLLIAAAAEARRITVLHYDSDFDIIANVTGQPTQWVVPHGFVDRSDRIGHSDQITKSAR